MTEQVVATLSALRDVEGVLGCFLIDPDGRMLARDIPVLFDPQSLARAGEHLSRLRAALESAGGAFESCVTRFGPHVLLLRAAAEDTLCVLCPRGTNLRAVLMSSTLIARRLDSLRRGSWLPPTPNFAATDTRLSAEASADGRPSPRFYRGRPV